MSSSITAPPSNNHCGFTLLEVLVVLMLLSLVVSLLAEGLSMTFNQRERIIAAKNRHRTETLQTYWFQTLCSAFTPEKNPEKKYFSGNPNSIHGLCLTPLQNEAGAPRRITLTIKQKGPLTSLTYTESIHKEIELGRWRAVEGRFSFLDTKGIWRDRWPPRTFEKTARLPRAIKFTIDMQGSTRIWLTPVKGRSQPRIWLEDSFL